LPDANDKKDDVTAACYRISEQLRVLGLAPGALLMVHASIRKIGCVCCARGRMPGRTTRWFGVRRLRRHVDGTPHGRPIVGRQPELKKRVDSSTEPNRRHECVADEKGVTLGPWHKSRSYPHRLSTPHPPSR
jgi:hypothetical protein